MIASFLGPTLFSGTAVMFIEHKTDAQVLAAWGSVLKPMPSRLILKRIALTGYPFRTHKKKAVVRYMFFNPEDINWYKPLELVTKNGLRGHIKEPLGTHGYMKCYFSDYIDASDIVILYLYKRVFPKWYPESWGGDPSMLISQSE